MPMVGRAEGEVVAVDLQQEMLAAMLKNADNARIGSIVTPVRCSNASLCIGKWDGKIDFALVFMVLHEVPDHPNLQSGRSGKA